MKRLCVLALIAVFVAAATGCMRETANKNSGAISVRLQTGSTETVRAGSGTLNGATVAFTGLAEPADVSISLATRRDLVDFVTVGPVVEFSATNLQNGPASFIAANLSVPFDPSALNNDQVWLYTQSGTETPVRINTATASGNQLSATVNSFSRFWAMTGAGTPVVSSFHPSIIKASGGATITLRGKGFLVSSGTPAVTVGGVAATNVTVVDAETITFTAPAGSGGQVIEVSTANGMGASTAHLNYVD